MTTIGIPRGMLFYDYGSLWSDYFAILGVPCITSPESTKKTLAEGTMLGIDESCLPLKIFLGHVQSILDDCTHIFVPRIAQHHKNYYYCAKFAGLPDIVRNTFNIDERRILSPNIEDKNFSTIYKACHTIAAQVGFSPINSYIAYRKALRNYKKRCSPSLNNQPNVIAVLGHSYLIHDPFLTQEIKKVVSALLFKPKG
jgi:predicted nucleotide-binding protein (sugar kinase/HSP70/actin superfamily)